MLLLLTILGGWCEERTVYKRVYTFCRPVNNFSGGSYGWWDAQLSLARGNIAHELMTGYTSGVMPVSVSSIIPLGQLGLFLGFVAGWLFAETAEMTVSFSAYVSNKIQPNMMRHGIASYRTIECKKN